MRMLYRANNFSIVLYFSSSDSHLVLSSLSWFALACRCASTIALQSVLQRATEGADNASLASGIWAEHVG
jgi:hypothetical protein